MEGWGLPQRQNHALLHILTVFQNSGCTGYQSHILEMVGSHPQIRDQLSHERVVWQSKNWV